jgi:hypothetical protein
MCSVVGAAGVSIDGMSSSSGLCCFSSLRVVSNRLIGVGKV